jgi:hypothetical protein
MGRAARQRRGAVEPTRSARKPVLGIDIGGVLVDRVAEGSDTSFFGDRPMETPMTDGSLDAVRDLVGLFEGRVYIVSKAGPKIAELSRRWLGRHEFTGPSMIPIEHISFVRKRPEKHEVCEQLGITHFVDDRLDVLEHLRSVDRRYLFTGGLGSNEQPRSIPDAVVHVDSWSRLTALLRAEVG